VGNDKLKGLVLYGHWVNCIKEKCGEGYNDKCHVPGGQSDYPQDGKCFNDFYKPIDEIDDSEIGAFETIGQASAPADIPF
jgi:hypothetical protein